MMIKATSGVLSSIHVQASTNRLTMKRILLLLLLLLALVVTSCAPKIYGARPHRRDRNCGCERQQPVENHQSDICLTSL